MVRVEGRGLPGNDRAPYGGEELEGLRGQVLKGKKENGFQI